MNKRIRMNKIAIFGMTTLFLTSCASPYLNLGASHNTIDPALIGTWVGINSGRGGGTAITSLSPDGTGDIFVRSRGRFGHVGITWRTRSGVLEIRKRVNLLESLPTVTINGQTLGADRIKIDAPNGILSRTTVAFVGSARRKAIHRSISDPRRTTTTFKYSNTPTKDPYPVYSWFDRGSYRS